MSKSNEIAEAVRTAAREREDGRLVLPCKRALGIAEDLDVPPAEVGHACNEQRIKIVGCQLGCFK